MSQGQYLEVADTLGARLCRDAIWAGKRCNWLGDSMELLESRWQVARRALGAELYNGTSGIGLYLAHLYASTQEKAFRKTAKVQLTVRCLNWTGLILQPVLDFIQD